MSELRDFLKAKLPEYMVPAAFVSLGAMPLTPNGKIDRRALPAPASLRPELAGTYVMPQIESEKLIAAVWQDVLKLDNVGRKDNFFDLGGHSLLIVQVREKLQSILQQELSMVEMFKYPTIQALAEHLQQERQKVSSQSEKTNDIIRIRKERQASVMGKTTAKRVYLNSRVGFCARAKPGSALLSKKRE